MYDYVPGQPLGTPGICDRNGFYEPVFPEAPGVKAAQAVLDDIRKEIKRGPSS